MTPRLLLEATPSPGSEARLSAEQSHYLVRVLRLSQGAPVQVFDGQGRRFRAHLLDASPRSALLGIDEELPATPESPLRITLAQCVSAAEKMDWTIEKAVELGVWAIQPLLSKRSVVRLDAQRSRKRAEHWQRLIVAACMQCGRDRVPALAAPIALEDWLDCRDRSIPGLVMDPGASASLSAIGTRFDAIDLLVGPESGLDGSEIAAAREAGFDTMRLGPRVLRTETAGLAAITVLQSRFGDL
jgi:16S rRNA (uracil1498-N3)-methyltransferase